MKKKIVIVEDDAAICQLLEMFLKKNLDNLIYSSNDGEEGINLIYEVMPDLIILDWNLPHLSGIEICRSLKCDPRTKKIPVMMLTAFSQMSNKLCAFEMGANDYLSKPFDLKEFMLRTQSLISLSEDNPETAVSILKYEGLEINRSAHTLKVNGKPAHLCYKEFQILWMLLRKKEEVVRVKDIKAALWDDPLIPMDGAIQCYVTRIREKLGKEAGTFIQNIPGVGYKIASPELIPA